jgi:UDP-N-acetylglucosamine 2-epimerase
VIGNSSSGIMEAPSFNLPTINIGDRQARRMRAQSVIDCAATPAAIQEAIHRGLSLDCSGFDNPYGDGRAARHIVDTLAKIDTPRSLTRKSFVDLPL